MKRACGAVNASHVLFLGGALTSIASATQLGVQRGDRVEVEAARVSP
jgi:hypothetical protein